MEAGASTLTDEALEATDKGCATGGDVADTDTADGASGDAADDSVQKKRKKAFRFLPSSDVILLKEVIKHTPWTAGHGKTEAAWGKVASGIKAALPLCTADGKACRRRFYTLMEVFKREELESLRASGTAEDYEEREQLLTDCFELTEGHAQQKADKTEKEKRDAERREAASADIVRSAMQGMRNKRALSSDTELATPPPVHTLSAMLLPDASGLFDGQPFFFHPASTSTAVTSSKPPRSYVAARPTEASTAGLLHLSTKLMRTVPIVCISSSVNVRIALANVCRV